MTAAPVVQPRSIARPVPEAVKAPRAGPPSGASSGSAGAGASASKEVSLSSMPPELVEYCAAQVAQLKGDVDAAVLEYMYSLESAAEVRECIAQLLGSTPQVRSCAAAVQYCTGLYSCCM